MKDSKLFNKEDIRFFAILLLFCTFLRVFILKPVVVEGQSMYPTLENGEAGFSFLVSRTNLKRGDIVILNVHDDINAREVLLVKRVVGLPGEEVRVSGQAVYINGQPLLETYPVYDYDMQESTITLKDDEYYCLGDNRSHSRDSRVYGPFTSKDIVAKGFLAVPFLKLIRK